MGHFTLSTYQLHLDSLKVLKPMENFTFTIHPTVTSLLTHLFLHAVIQTCAPTTKANDKDTALGT